MWRYLIAACLLTLAACDQATNPEQRSGPIVASTDRENVAFCNAIEELVTAEECTLLNEMASGVAPGWASFRVPETMRRDTAYTLVLAMSRQEYEPPPPPETETPAATETPVEQPAPEPTQRDPARPDESATMAPRSDETGEAAVESPPRTPRDMLETIPGELHEFAPPVGRYMEAHLNQDGGFEITALSPTGQVVPDDGSPVTWRWRVRPTEQGSRHLELRTVAMGCLDEGRQRCFLFRQTAFPYSVDVSVGWWGKFLDWLRSLPDLFKIITAVLVGLTSLVGAAFGLRNAFRKGRNEG